MKLVRESINFERNVEPKEAMHTGDRKYRAKVKILKVIDELSKKFPIKDISDEPIYPEPSDKSLVHFKHSNTRYFMFNTFRPNENEGWVVGFWFPQGNKINWMTNEEDLDLEACTALLDTWFKTLEIS